MNTLFRELQEVYRVMFLVTKSLLQFRVTRTHSKLETDSGKHFLDAVKVIDRGFGWGGPFRTTRQRRGVGAQFHYWMELVQIRLRTLESDLGWNRMLLNMKTVRLHANYEASRFIQTSLSCRQTSGKASRTKTSRVMGKAYDLYEILETVLVKQLA